MLLVKREASDAISPRSTEHSDTQQYPDQERSKEAALPPATVTVNVAAAAIGGQYSLSTKNECQCTSMKHIRSNVQHIDDLMCVHELEPEGYCA